MTKELLEKACELDAKIEYCKDVLRALDSCYENFIRFSDFKETRDISKTIYLSNESELEKYIREYFVHKLKVLEQEFAELV